MPPFIVDLSQDSDEDEFYVAQQFHPTTRSPPTLLASKPSPLKKQSRMPRRPASSSSSSVSLISSPSRKTQQPITSFLSSPNIKREAVVQKSITSFFPFQGQQLQRVYPNPRVPRVLFTTEQLSVDDSEAPVPESFEVNGMSVSGFSARSLAEITSSPPTPFEVVEVDQYTTASPSRPPRATKVAVRTGPGEEIRVAERIPTTTAAETTAATSVRRMSSAKVEQSPRKALSNKRPFTNQSSMPLKNGDNEDGKRRADFRTPKYFAIASGTGSGPNVNTDQDFHSLDFKSGGKKQNDIPSRFKAVISNRKSNISGVDIQDLDGGFEMEPNNNYSTGSRNFTLAISPQRQQQSNIPAPTLQSLSSTPGPSRILRDEFNKVTEPAPTPQPTQTPTKKIPQFLPPVPVIMSRPPSPLTLHSPQLEDPPKSEDDDNDSNDYSDDDDDDFLIHPTKLKRNERGEVICTIHGDPGCLEPECVHVFFEKYCPFQHTVPGENARVSADFVPRHRLPVTPIKVIEETLDPAEARRELIAMLIASGNVGKKRRLPYMSPETKDYIRNSPGVMMDLMRTCDGELLHVQFTAKEVMLLGSAIVNYAENKGFYIDYPPQSDNLYNDIHNLIATLFAGCKDIGPELRTFLTATNLELPGRYREDIQNFLTGAFTSVPDPHDPIVFVELPQGPTQARVFRDPVTRRVKEEFGWKNTDPMMAARNIYNDVFGMLEPVWKFGEGSSDVHDIVWSPNGERFGMATTCFNDGYNRPGNLMLGTVDPWKVKMLYRHAFRVRPQTSGNLERYSYATVSSIRFSNDSSLLFSSGYDGFVKVWNAKDSSWITDIHLNDKIMLMESSRIALNLLAAGCFKGSVNILRLGDSGSHINSTVLHISKADELKKGLYPSCFVWGNKDYPSHLVAGYDNSTEEQRHGGLAIWDVEYSRNLFKGSTKGLGGPQRHFDVSMHEIGGKFVTASLKSGRYVGGSIVRLYDLADMKGVIEFDSTQMDINKVTISPCQGYVTSSGTNGSTIVWDTRNPSDILFELKHDESVLPITETTNVEAEDTGVTFAKWGQYNDAFFTGSSDGKIKQWNITTGTPFIRDIAQVDTQIMSASFSPSWDELIVGECSGSATLFSTRGDKGVPPSKIMVDWAEEEGKVNPDEENMPFSDWDGRREREEAETEADQEESGVQMARELVAEGLMWVDNKGMAWATDKYEEIMKERKKGKEV